MCLTFMARFRFQLTGALLVASIMVAGCQSESTGPGELSSAQMQGDAIPMPSPDDIARQTDYVNSDRTIQANAYLNISGNNEDYAEPSGTDAVFSPEYDGGPASSFLQAARVSYRFFVPDFSGPNEINLRWISPPSSADSLWLGMANWDANRWEWFQGTTDRVEIGDLTDYQSESKGVMVVIVLLGTTVAKLDWIRLGSELWHIEKVPAGDDRGVFSNLALDADGLPHIACYDLEEQDLVYFHQAADGTWSNEVIDDFGDLGLYPSIAIRQSGEPGIAYFDAGRKKLKLASFWQGAWQTTFVDPNHNAGWYPSLQYDAEGYPHIAYYKAYNILCYTIYNGEEFEYTQIDTTGVSDNGSISLKLDDSANPYIAYTTHDGVAYTWREGAAWHCEDAVIGDVVLTTNQALSHSSFDKPAIVAFDATALMGKLLTKAAGNWSCLDIPFGSPCGTSIAMAQTGSGSIRLACYAEGLGYASRQMSIWSPVMVDTSGMTGMYVSIALDSSNFPHISYYDSVNSCLMYVRYSNP